MDQNGLMDILEVANYMGIHKITLYRLIKENKIPAFKVGRQWRFKKELLEHWIQENTTKKKDGKKISASEPEENPPPAKPLKSA